MMKSMRASAVENLQGRLLDWYQKNARDLPWRRAPDPYKIWVSEIMLQQTRVETVIPYYQKWLKRFPTLSSLAKAPSSEVMKQWAGLGYYRRARMLHRAARLLHQGKGEIPHTVPELMRLPGIGRYTAGAIASIAFDERAPVLDGNVIRVLTRVLAYGRDVRSPGTIQKLWAVAESLLPETGAGDFNQALMELGATVCLPDHPQCGLCPLAALCRAHLGRCETRFPVKKGRERIENIRAAALVVRNNGRVLIQKQPAEGRWGGLWMFPHGSDPKAVMRNFRIRGRRSRHCLTLLHGFTKYRVTLKVFEATLPAFSTFPHPPASRWVRLKDLTKFAFPSPHLKIVNHLLKTDAKRASA